MNGMQKWIKIDFFVGLEINMEVFFCVPYSTYRLSLELSETNYARSDNHRQG